MAVAGRGAWGSRFGFILAAAGSAVGLGNIWGFPTQVGQGGGAAFVLVYLACVALICFPIMIAELAIGRRSQKSPVGAFATLRPGSKWWLVGALGVMAGVGILSFYSVIAGWTAAYVWFTFTGSVSAESIGVFFGAFTGNVPLNLGLTAGILIVTALIIAGGVSAGIERATKAMMPLLILLLIVLAARALTLPGAADGLAYYLKPDLSRVFHVSVVNAALGQAFFSLSLGMGAMITYGSYLSRSEGIVGAALWVAALDTAIALLAGFIIFPAGFSIPGFDPAAGGAGLIFTVLPRLFATLPGGELFGGAFFILLTMAALTSTISLLEVPVSYLIDDWGWTRHRAVVAVTALTLALAVPSVLATAGVGVFASLPGVGMDFLTLMATVWNNFSLPIGGFFTALFVGYVWKAGPALDELRHGGAWFPLPGLWVFLVRYVCPAAILLIIVFTIRGLLA
jgi:NSS family neurotransmitter:Na+ symporter